MATGNRVANREWSCKCCIQLQEAIQDFEKCQGSPKIPSTFSYVSSKASIRKSLSARQMAAALKKLEEEQAIKLDILHRKYKILEFAESEFDEASRDDDTRLSMDYTLHWAKEIQSLSKGVVKMSVLSNVSISLSDREREVFNKCPDRESKGNIASKSAESTRREYRNIFKQSVLKPEAESQQQKPSHLNGTDGHSKHTNEPKVESGAEKVEFGDLGEFFRQNRSVDGKFGQAGIEPKAQGAVPKVQCQIIPKDQQTHNPRKILESREREVKFISGSALGSESTLVYRSKASGNFDWDNLNSQTSQQPIKNQSFQMPVVQPLMQSYDIGPPPLVQSRFGAQTDAIQNGSQEQPQSSSNCCGRQSSVQLDQRPNGRAANNFLNGSQNQSGSRKIKVGSSIRRRSGSISERSEAIKGSISRSTSVTRTSVQSTICEFGSSNVSNSQRNIGFVFSNITNVQPQSNVGKFEQSSVPIIQPQSHVIKFGLNQTTTVPVNQSQPNFMIESISSHQPNVVNFGLNRTNVPVNQMSSSNLGNVGLKSTNIQQSKSMFGYQASSSNYPSAEDVSNIKYKSFNEFPNQRQQFNQLMNSSNERQQFVDPNSTSKFEFEATNPNIQRSTEFGLKVLNVQPTSTKFGSSKPNSNNELPDTLSYHLECVGINCDNIEFRLYDLWYWRMWNRSERVTSNPFLNVWRMGNRYGNEDTSNPLLAVPKPKLLTCRRGRSLDQSYSNKSLRASYGQSYLKISDYDLVNVEFELNSTKVLQFDIGFNSAKFSQPDQYPNDMRAAVGNWLQEFGSRRRSCLKYRSEAIKRSHRRSAKKSRSVKSFIESSRASCSRNLFLEISDGDLVKVGDYQQVNRLSRVNVSDRDDRKLEMVLNGIDQKPATVHEVEVFQKRIVHKSTGDLRIRSALRRIMDYHQGQLSLGDIWHFFPGQLVKLSYMDSVNGGKNVKNARTILLLIRRVENSFMDLLLDGVSELIMTNCQMRNLCYPRECQFVSGRNPSFLYNIVKNGCERKGLA